MQLCIFVSSLSGSSSSIKSHGKGSTITKEDILMETRVRTSASESDSDVEVADAADDNNEVFVRPKSPLKEISQNSLPTPTEPTSSSESTEGPVVVTKPPEIHRISPPPEEKIETPQAAPPLPTSPVPMDVSQPKTTEKRPSAEPEDVSFDVLLIDLLYWLLS